MTYGSGKQQQEADRMEREEKKKRLEELGIGAKSKAVDTDSQ